MVGGVGSVVAATAYGTRQTESRALRAVVGPPYPLETEPFPDLTKAPETDAAAVVSLSPQAQQAVTESEASGESEEVSTEDEAEEGLTDEEKAAVEALQKRDSEVHAHEQAHISAGAGLTSGATFTYEQGPDGKRYAVGGEVSIDTSPAQSPEATIQKAQTIRQAALAPVDPSGQDMSVAALATRMEAAARQEAAEKVQDASADVKAVRTAAPESDPAARAESASPSVGKLRDPIDIEGLSTFVGMPHMHASPCGYCGRAVGQYSA